METKEKKFNASEAVEEIKNGNGYIIIPDFLTSEEVESVTRKLQSIQEKIDRKVGEPPSNDDSIRVWNLPHYDDLFVKLMQRDHRLIQILQGFFGSEFHCGSWTSNTLLPGTPCGNVHVDHPYRWNYRIKEGEKYTGPPLTIAEIQTIIMLDDFTAENGATWVVPGSQAKQEYPPETRLFFKQGKQMIGKAGSIFIAAGTIWHCSGENKTKENRACLLGQFLPRSVRPMEKWKDIANKMYTEAQKKRKKNPLLWQLVEPHPDPQEDVSAYFKVPYVG